MWMVSASAWILSPFGLTGCTLHLFDLHLINDANLEVALRFVHAAVDAIIVILVAYLLFILQVTNYPIRCGNPNHLAGIRDEGVAISGCSF